MMIVGYDFLGDKQAISDTRIKYDNIDDVTIKNAIYDELFLKNGTDDFNINRDNWNYATVLLAKFRNNLNAGNIDLGKGNTSFIEIRKRKIEDLNDWKLVGRVPYADKRKIYFYDDLVDSGQTYEYALIPMAYDDLNNLVEGEPVKETVTVEFEDIFIIDKDKRFRLRYEIRQNSIERITRRAVIEPLGSRYPVVISNGVVNYHEGSIRAKLISDMNRFRAMQGEKIDRRMEYKFIDDFSNFLIGSSNKVIKYPNGSSYLVNITETVPLEYDPDLYQSFADVYINWVEVGDMNDENLIESGLIKNG